MKRLLLFLLGFIIASIIIFILMPSPIEEDVAIDSMGRIYGGQLNGDIVEFDKAGNRKVIANTKGRPLGLHFDKQKNLIVADATSGLLSIDINTGKVTI